MTEENSEQQVAHDGRPIPPLPEGEAEAEIEKGSPYFSKNPQMQELIEEPVKGLAAVQSDLKSLSDAVDAVRPSGAVGELLAIIQNQQAVLDKAAMMAEGFAPIMNAAGAAIPVPEKDKMFTKAEMDAVSEELQKLKQRLAAHGLT